MDVSSAINHFSVIRWNLFMLVSYSIKPGLKVVLFLFLPVLVNLICFFIIYWNNFTIFGY